MRGSIPETSKPIVSKPTKRITKRAKASATVPASAGMEFLDFRLEKAVRADR
jgi:hypothetical protein